MTWPVVYVRCPCAVWPVVPGYSVGAGGRCGSRPDRPATAEEYEEDRKQWTS